MILAQTELHIYGSSRIGIYNVNIDVTNTANISPTTIFTRGNKFFELSNHLGNVLVTVSDKKIQHSSNNSSNDYYLADVVTANDYYPFGMAMPGRQYRQANSGYRYGFNGKELDNEIYSEGNAYTAEFCEYDKRLQKIERLIHKIVAFLLISKYNFKYLRIIFLSSFLYIYNLSIYTQPQLSVGLP